jgi:hypothetical protein
MSSRRTDIAPLILFIALVLVLWVAWVQREVAISDGGAPRSAVVQVSTHDASGCSRGKASTGSDY